MTTPFHPRGVGKVRNKNTTTSATNTHKNAVQISSNILFYYPTPIFPQLKPNPNPPTSPNKYSILQIPSKQYIQLPGVYNLTMEQLSGANYQSVLKYMETVNEQNFETAIQVMKQYDFNLQMAINQRFQPQNNRPQPHQNQGNDEEVVRKYVDFLEKKNNQWNLFSAVFNVTKYIIVGILSSVVRLILPSSLYDRFFGNPFQKIYNSKLQSRYNHRKYTEYLAKTKNLSSKAVLVVISPKREHPQLIAFLNNAAIQKKIHLNYFLCCYIIESDEIKTIEGFREGPQIIALRWNIFEEIVEVGRERDIKNVNVDLLGRWTLTSRNLFKRDNNVLVKYRNLLAKYHGLQYEEEEEEEVNLVQRDMEREEITQQDRAYREAEERAAKTRQERQIQRRKEEEEASKIRELEEERQIRKMSIPDQPTSGQILRISFRCPDGSTVLRNFLSNEKLQLIYHWIQLNDSIEFQDPKRNFQLMYSFPPEPLSSKKHLLLSEVFESQQEKVVIRQL